MTKGFFESQRGLSSKVQILIQFSLNMSVFRSFIACFKRKSALKLGPKNEVQLKNIWFMSLVTTLQIPQSHLVGPL